MSPTSFISEEENEVFHLLAMSQSGIFVKYRRSSKNASPLRRILEHAESKTGIAAPRSL
jgi:hypothetical protein